MLSVGSTMSAREETDLMSRTAILAILLPLCSVSVVRADHSELDRLKEEYAEKESAFHERMSKAEEYDAKSHPAIAYTPKFKAFAEDHAGAPEAVPALIWILEKGMSGSDDLQETEKIRRWAVDRVAADYAASPYIEDAFAYLQYLPQMIGDESLISLYEKVLRENESRSIRARAMFNLAYTHYSFLPGLGRTAVGGNRAARKKKGVAGFRQVIKDFPDESIAKKAKGLIFEIERPQIGMKALDIVGTDAYGKKIRLSQYLGQVVVLDFWGFW